MLQSNQVHTQLESLSATTRSSLAATKTQHNLMIIINILFKKEVTLFEETKERKGGKNLCLCVLSSPM